MNYWAMKLESASEILKRHSVCVCVNMSLSTAKWKRELRNNALACCHPGCLFFHSFFFFTTFFCANNEKYNYLRTKKKKGGMTPQTSVSEEGGMKVIQTETWRSHAWFRFSGMEFLFR